MYIREKFAILALMRTSYSALDTYQTCPLKFKWQVLDRIRTADTKEAIFGNAAHSALKFMFTRSPLFPTLDEVIDAFRNIWQEKKSRSPVIWNDIAKQETPWDEDAAGAYLENGILMLKKFYKENPPWNFNILNLETRFEVILEDPETKTQHILAGIMDRIDKNQDGSYEIIDYKTASRMPIQEKVNQNLQMSIYHLGLIKQWPHLESADIKLSLYFLKHGEKISTRRTKEELEATKKNIISLINEIQEGQKTNNFPPTPSALCDWCGYRPNCPMWKHEYKESQISNLKSQKEIEEMLKEYFELKENNQKNTQRISEIQAAVHNFMDNEKIERVFSESGYLTRSVKTANVYNWEIVREVLEPLGIWKSLFKIDQLKIEKLILTLPHPSQEKIRAAILETKQTKMLTATKKRLK